ncbi:ABC transporter substrate-binding protein [Acetanaerobacterium elongatum]|uniref:NitT/TauT family transport system substrate-binding protein n=1 Tax=Acetanaerobacterium elongatum TaxID=258515 RepID=A0A1H0ALC1_9FIRM|nr:ABC transporter substrate-binding protein [Acetanaerobacterium elongatum]SDN34151.1 NitT/TauT family transport system substrate-binding protein [Acetanaerobacterium elongatum]
MTKILRLACLVLCALMVLTGAAGCGQKPQAVRLKVSEVTHSVFYAPQYAALNLGYFADEGLEIELSNGQGADKVMTAVLTGAVDIGFAGPEASIYVYNEGKADYCEVFAQLTQRDGAFLIGRQKEDAFDFTQTKGKVVLPGRKGGVPYMTLEYVFKQHGVVPGKDVTFDDSVQFAMMTGAFTGGTGDYVTAFEPTASKLEQEGKGYILASIGKESGEIPYTAYFASKSYIEKNKDLVKKFIRAIYRGQQWVAKSSPKEIANVIAASFPDTDIKLLEKSAASYKGIEAWCTSPVMKAEAYEKLQTVMTEAGELKQKAPFDKVVNNSLAKEVINP